MGKYATVMIEQHGPVAVVSLNRPDKLNSFDAVLRRELLPAVREVNDDDSVRVVGSTYTHEQTVTLVPAQLLVVDFDSDTHKFVVK